jgi:UDP-N-acetylglucosamine--N-acetylmuramyl-(pentapeptide) pyrophosphoryl-undecaprenol N-acetylglucosamine transferase
VHLAASGGGHLELLLHLREALSGYARVWVTTPGGKAQHLVQEGERVELVPAMDRRNLNLANPLRCLRLAASERPPLVLTSGAGVVASFVAGARALGARVLFVETMARVRSPSAAGRVLSRIADDFFVQWPGLLEVYPRARLCRPLLLGDIAPAPAVDAGRGTFVALGSHSQPFDRLLRVVDDAAARGVLPTPVHVQAGASAYASPRLTVVPWLPEDRFDTELRGARYVVCHAGASVIAQALRAGRRPLVMRRDGALGEHVDDHQAELLDELERRGLVRRIEREITAADLGAADARWPASHGWEELPDLREAIPDALERRSAWTS